MRRFAVLVIVSLIPAIGVSDAAANEPPPFSECLPASASAVTVGVIECQVLPSAHLGANAPFSYYVPPECDPVAHEGVRCPVVYLLHGTGGSYRGLGAKGAPPSDFGRAMRMRPPEDPLTAPEPWTLTPDTWVPAEPLPFVLVAPHNKTLPGGFGPAPDMDGLWSDWNPRYARDGDSPQYQTPPPRFESFLVEELLPFVDHLLPVGRSRGYRATVGGSQGGFGALKYALQHPDLFAASGSISGGSLPLGRYLKPASPVGIQPPLDVPYVQLPGVTPSLEYPPESNYLVIPSIMPAYGDPVADHTYWEGEMPSGIASNGRAFLDGRQAVAFRLTVGDAIPRRPQDVNVGLEGYEILTHITTREMARAFDLEELGYELLIRPGHHGEPYISPYHRLMVEFLWRNMRHPDGSGIERDRPERFDYRTIRTSVSIWGWAFSVERQPTEWLNLTSVGCDGLTLRGTGVVQVTVPAFCGTGLDGSTTFEIDLGPDQATDQPAHVGHYDVYGATRTITLTPL